MKRTEAEAIAAVAPLTADMLPWQHHNGAPRNTFVLLRGPSGTRSTEYRYMVAKHDGGYRPLAPWRDVDGDSITDCGWNLERDLIEWAPL